MKSLFFFLENFLEKNEIFDINNPRTVFNNSDRSCFAFNSFLFKNLKLTPQTF